MKRLGLSLILFIGLVVGACQKRDSSAPASLAYITNGIASFWVIAEAGAKAAGKELGVPVSVHMPAEGITDQKRIIEDLLIKGTGGIAISPIDPVNQTSLINDAAAQTNVITHDSDAPTSKRLAYIGMDNYLAGRMVGELLKEALPDGGLVMIFIGRLEQDNARRRRQGVIDELLNRSVDGSRYDPPGSELKGEKFTILGTLTDQFDRAKGKANVEDSLSKYPSVHAMVGLFAYNTPLILEALKQSGKLGSVKVVSFDEADETLAGIQQGTVFGTVVQNPFQYGYESIKLLAALQKGDRSMIPASGFLDIPARKIVRANVDSFWTDLKQKLGK